MWRLRLLGDISLSSGSRDIRRLRASKYAFLLAFLSIHPDRAFSREELIELFWPEFELEAGRLCLRTALASLRRQLDEPHLFLAGSRDLIKLNKDLLVTDVAEFEHAVQIKSPQARLLYGGEFLPGCYDDWAALERLRLDALFSLTENAKPESLAFSEALPHPKVSALPTPTSNFFGRREELALLSSLVEQSRLISLIGLGGIGKTRVAIEMGRVLECSSRVFFVAAASCEEDFQLTNLTASVLAIAKNPSDSLEERVDLKLAECATVLILDNFEQLIEAGFESWVERRIHNSPNLKIFVTSRIPLGLDGERQIEIGPMRLEDAKEMFMDRARSVLPDFPRYEKLDELCQQLDKIPLAIALCAARANVLTGSAMHQGLDRKFEILKSSRPGKQNRQASLRAVLDWACPAQIKLHDSLCCLAVFKDGWTLEAATAILQTSALEDLSTLRQRSLIGISTGTDNHRFSMLDAVREYALETADPSVIRTSIARHSRYYRRLATEIASRHREDEWGSFQALDLESANIFAAFDSGLGLELKSQIETAEAIHYARWCLWVRGYGRSLLHTFHIAESRVEASKGLIRGWLLKFAAEAAGSRRDYGVAIQRLIEANALFLANGLIEPASDSLQVAAHYHELSGHLEEAIRCIQRQVEIIPEEDQRARNIALAGLAHMYLNPHGSISEARQIYSRLESYWDNQSDGAGHLALIRQGLASCHSALGEYDRAIPLLLSSIQTFRELGETQREVFALRKLAEVYGHAGDRQQSDQLLIQIASLS